MWILRCFVLVHRFSCELELIKSQNSQTWQIGWTTNFMCKRWNFNQKLKIWTWLHKMRFSCRITKKHVSINSEMSFTIFTWKCVFAIQGERVSHGVRWKKKFWSWWKSALCWENKWEVWVFILRNFFLTLPTLMEWKILKTQAKSSLLSKISSKTLTPRLLSLSSNLNGENEVHRLKIRGLYRWW